MASASKHKQRSSRAHQQRPNFERYFYNNAHKLYVKKMFQRMMESNAEEAEDKDENV